MALHALAEKRKLERLAIQAVVFDAETGKLLGTTLDMHTMGMLVMSNKPLPLEADFSVLLEFPGSNGEAKRIPLTARGVWTMQNAIPFIHNTGCCFVGQNLEQVEQLRQILEHQPLH